MFVRTCEKFSLSLYKISNDTANKAMIHQEYNSELAHNLAARLGLVVGGCWTVSFLIVVLNFPSFLSDLGYLFGLLSIVIVGRNIRGLATFVMPMRWSQRFIIAFLSFMGGTLLTSLAQYLYLAFLDHGHFMNAMLENVTDPTFVKVMKEAGNGELLKTLTENIKQMSEMTPRIFAINLFTTNTTLALVFSLIASLFKGKKIETNN